MSCIHKILKFTNKNVNIFDISWISIWVSTAHPGPSWSHGHLICNYLCNLCLSQTNIGSSNPVHGMVNSIQHYVIKFVSDVCHVGCFLRFASLIKPTATIMLMSFGFTCSQSLLNDLTFESLDHDASCSGNTFRALH